MNTINVMKYTKHDEPMYEDYEILQSICHFFTFPNCISSSYNNHNIDIYISKNLIRISCYPLHYLEFMHNGKLKLYFYKLILYLKTFSYYEISEGDNGEYHILFHGITTIITLKARFIYYVSYCENI